MDLKLFFAMFVITLGITYVVTRILVFNPLAKKIKELESVIEEIHNEKINFETRAVSKFDEITKILQGICDDLRKICMKKVEYDKMFNNDKDGVK